ncbi:MAG: putative toxin-antitoxin system toxin component, PIN family, partial [Acidobacteriota bacterium]
ALQGTLQACVTDQVWAEYHDVLLREKFRGVRARAEQLLGSLDAAVLRVVAGEAVNVASDEDDNRFLECAAAAAADYLVTGNLRHYPPEHAGTRVVNARVWISTVLESP